MTDKKKEGTGSAGWGGLMGKIAPVLLPIMIFLALTNVSRIVALIAAAVALTAVLGRGQLAVLGRRTGPLIWAAAVYAGVSLCSGLWSDFGNYAVGESCKILTAFAVFLLAVFRARSSRQALHWLNGAAAVVAFFCIEGSSLNLLTPLFNTARQLLGYDASVFTGYETGVRITGIYGNANVSAGVLAMGLLAALYTVRTVQDRRSWRGLAAYVLLGLEALAFLLSFSMGAMGTFAVTCLVYLAVSSREERLPLFLLMLETVVVTLVCAFLATPGLGQTGAIAAAPAALSLLCGPGIWAADCFAGQPAAEKLQNRGKAAGAIVAGVLVLLAVYAALALRVTGPLSLTAGETVSRAVYLDPGSYTVTAEGADPDVEVYTQNRKDLMMHTETVLYQGPLSQAAFQVPEDSSVVWFRLSGAGELKDVTLSDGTALHLGYRLLPAFAANRLQGLRTNQNFIQRLVFFEDGIRLWLQRPVTGWGLGGVEGGVTSVQSFYYESKYVHNQFIQILAEAGIPGILAFLFLLAAAFWTLLRRGDRKDPLFAALLACLVMMIAHSMVEMVWSMQEYQTAVMLIFAAICLLPRRQEAEKGAMAAGAALAMWAVVAVFGVLSACNLSARLQMLSYGTTSPSAFINKALQLDKMDVYDTDEYKVPIIKTALQNGSQENFALAEECAQALRDRGEFTGCRSVAVYYDLPWRMIQVFFADCRTGILQEASSSLAWNRLIETYRWAGKQLEEEYMEDYLTGVLDTAEELESFNAGRMGPIVLEQEEQDFLDFCRQLEGRDAGTIYQALQRYLQDAEF